MGILRRIWEFIAKPDPYDVPPEEPPAPPMASGFFSTDSTLPVRSRAEVLDIVNARQFQAGPPVPVSDADGNAVAMDSNDFSQTIKGQFAAGSGAISEGALLFFSANAFPGFQTLAILAQNWLIAKCCTMPAEDAVRKGWSLSGDAITPEVEVKIKALDTRYAVVKKLIEFERFSRIFGIRVVMFKVRPPAGVTEAEYYEKPFNPDGVTPGSYEGIVQVDPYWMAPQLDLSASADPTSLHFYEPTWWNINGRKVHRTHLVIARGDEVADVLKPSYLYAGVSVPQKIYERVYASERSANEAPMLLMTKRLTVQNIDIGKAIANQGAFEVKAQLQSTLRDNYGSLFVGKEDVVTQLETSLSEVDNVMLAQYQLVAAAANVPATKLMGTTPKGFNATGEYEEASYHELLESIQSAHMTPLLARHYLLLSLSHFDGQLGSPDVVWEPLDSPTGMELADIRLKNAQAAQALADMGAIDGTDERERIKRDPLSGYDGLTDQAPPDLGE